MVDFTAEKGKIASKISERIAGSYNTSDGTVRKRSLTKVTIAKGKVHETFPLSLGLSNSIWPEI
jgi:hypothetical protein